MAAGDLARYEVVLDLRRIGDFGLGDATRKVPTLERSLDRLKSRIGDMGSAAQTIGGAFDAVASSVGRIAVNGALVGTTAAIGALTYGVVGLNAEMQKTEVALGTMFSAQGFARNVPSGIEDAKGILKEMRMDAAKLPGEFSDLLDIFRTGGIPAFRSGLDPKEWEKLSSKVMAAGVVSSLPLDMVGREFGQLLEGRAGAHNVFGMRLMGLSGDKAKEFNQKSSEERLKLLTTELDKYAGAIDSFSKTYDAASSTFIDTVKYAGLRATAPLFDRVTSSLSEVNDWFSENEAMVSVWADRTGAKLGQMWDSGRKALEEWGPLIADFGARLYDRFGRIWVEIEPSVARFGDVLKDALKDPGTIDKLIMLGKLYIGAKAVGAVGGIGMGVIGDVGRVVGLVRDIRDLRGGTGLFPTMGGVAGALGAGAGTGASGAVGGAASIGSLAGGLATGGILAAGLAGWTYTIANFSDTLKDVTDYMEADTKARMASSLENDASLFRLDVAARVNDGMFGFASTLEHLKRTGNEYGRAELARSIREQAQRDAYFDSMFDLIEEQGRLTEAGDDAAAALVGLRMAALEAEESWNKDIEPKADRRMSGMAMRHGDDMAALALAKLTNEQRGTYGSKAPNKKPDGKHAHGGTHIQKVEIVVTSNKDPSRVALVIRDELAKLGRNRTASPDVPNFSRRD